MTVSDAMNWLSGGAQQYHTLYHCMRQDAFWVGLPWRSTWPLCDRLCRHRDPLAAEPARDRERQSCEEGPGAAQEHLSICGLCGYLFYPNQDVLACLAAVRHVHARARLLYVAVCLWGARDLKMILFGPLGRTDRLQQDFDQACVERDASESAWRNARANWLARTRLFWHKLLSAKARRESWKRNATSCAR